MADKPKVSVRKLSEFRPLEANPNRHTQRGLRALEDSVQEDGWVAPMTVAADGESLDGAARLEVAADKFPDEALVVEHNGSRPVVMVRTDVADAKSTMARRIIYRANRVAEIDLDWDADQLLADLEGGLDLSGLFGKDELDELLAGLVDEPTDRKEEAHRTLTERFVVPPFSVLDARQGYWQERKRAWIALGIQGELGRGELLTWVGGGRDIADMDETSRKNLAACRKPARGYGRCFGQDLMRGEHKVGSS